jgi:hypothetical protein
MKHKLLYLICSLPPLFLAIFYVLRIVFGMGDAKTFGFLCLLFGAVLSGLTPFILIILFLTKSSNVPLPKFIGISILGSVIYWTFCLLDLGREIHRFIAA